MTTAVATGRLPYWLWPWCMVLAALPFKQVTAGPAFVALQVGAASLLFLAPRPAAPFAPVRTLAVWALVSTLVMSYFFSWDPESTQSALLRVLLYMVLYMAATSVRLTPGEWLGTLRAWMWGGVLAAGLTLRGYLQGATSADGRAVLSLGGYTADPNYLAADMLVPLGIALSLCQQRPTRLEGIFAATVLVLCIVLTQSRGGALALVVLASAWLWQIGRRLTLVMLLGLLGGLYATFYHLLGRLNLASDPDGSMRTTIWQLLGPTGLEHWATGVGLEASFAVMAGASGFYLGLGPHNTYLQAFVEAGLFGLLALLAVLATHQAVRPSEPFLAPVRASWLAVAFAALFLQCLSYPLLWACWILAGQAAVLQSALRPTARKPMHSIGDHYAYLARR